jgi:hypothetical protein
MTNKILTAHVHRLHKGVLETYGPGDVAPDWVTNPALFDASAEDNAPEESDDTPSDGDGLDDMTGKDLAKLAGDEGIATSGSKQVLIDRIRGHRAAGKSIEPAAVAEDTGLVNDREVLVARATELGFEVDENTSEVELQALIDSKE